MLDYTVNCRQRYESAAPPAKENRGSRHDEWLRAFSGRLIFAG